MTPAERLEADRRRTTERLERLQKEHAGFVAASKDSNADDEHDPEGATIAFERSQVATVTRQHQQHLVEIDAALDRVEAGTYGVCEGCNCKIPLARLNALPYATYCIQCQRESEKYGSIGGHENDWGRVNDSSSDSEASLDDIEIDVS